MKCPGQDMQYWKPGDIFEADCSKCGNKIEFFKDEATRICKACRTKMMNPKMDFGCASYCKYASECLGDLGPALIAQRNDLLKDRVAIEVKRILGQDFQSIAHAVRVARFIEEMVKEEKVGPALLLCAAYLHTLIESSKALDTANDTQNGLRRILLDLGAEVGLINGVIDLLDRLESMDEGESKEAKLFLEAHRLAVMEEENEKKNNRN